MNLTQLGLHGAVGKSSASHTAKPGKFADMLVESQGVTGANAASETLTQGSNASTVEGHSIKGSAGRRSEKGEETPAARPGTGSTVKEPAEDTVAKLIVVPTTPAPPLVTAEAVRPKSIAFTLHPETSETKTDTKASAKSESQPAAHVSSIHCRPDLFDALRKTSGAGWPAQIAGPWSPSTTSAKHVKATVAEVAGEGKTVDHAAKLAARQDVRADEDNSMQASAAEPAARAFAPAANAMDPALLSRSPLHHAGITADDTNRATSKGSQGRTNVASTALPSSVSNRPARDGREINLAAHNPGPVLERFAENLAARGPQVQAEAHRKGGESTPAGTPQHGKASAPANATAFNQISEHTGAQDNGSAPGPAPTISSHAVQSVPVTHAGTSDPVHEVSRPLPPGHEQSMTQAAANRDAAGEVSTPVIGSALHAARLVERMGHSEVRLGIHAGEFGNVAIRTSLGRNQFTAEISVERGELGRVLAAELPNLHTRLSEHRLPEANVILQHPSSGGSGDAKQNSPQNQGMRLSGPGDKVERREVQVPMFAVEAAENSSRLDIHL